MRRDRTLVNIFLSEYGNYPKRDYPEDREQGAVDAIAEDQDGNSLAIEHTLVQPFFGEKDDARPFSVIFEALEKDTSLVLPEYRITVWPRVGSILTGTNWKELSIVIKDWFYKERERFPVGSSIQKPPNLPFELILPITKTHLPNYPGKVIVGRSDMPDTFESVIKKALSDKLPKLSAADTDKRVLLFEQDSIIQSPYDFTRAIEAVQSQFTELPNINEVWVAHTPVWESEKVVLFFQVWPEGIDRRLRFDD